PWRGYASGTAGEPGRVVEKALLEGVARQGTGLRKHGGRGGARLLRGDLELGRDVVRGVVARRVGVDAVVAAHVARDEREAGGSCAVPVVGVGRAAGAGPVGVVVVVHHVRGGVVRDRGPVAAARAVRAAVAPDHVVPHVGVGAADGRVVAMHEGAAL